MALEELFFEKYCGAGNDFIIFDGREKAVALEKETITLLCDRHFGIGADGVIQLLPSEKAQFKMDFFNSDGTPASMCGNGARSLAAFLDDHGILSQGTLEVGGIVYPFQKTDAGIFSVELTLLGKISFNLDLGSGIQAHFLNTGVPHAVVFVEDCEQAPFERLAPAIRHHPQFGKEGANVNFVQVTGPQSIKIRTYERGVEGETLACGTGAAASALVAFHLKKVTPPIAITVKSNSILSIDFLNEESPPKTIKSLGPAKKVFEGRFRPSWHPACI